jgi:uncharacterized surface protein with fasciclin (FAS1) repeats
MKRLLLLGLFILLSLVLVGCSSVAELVAGPASEAAAAPVEEPAEESAEEMAAVGSGQANEIVNDNSVSNTVVISESTDGISAAAAEPEAGTAEQEMAESESATAAAAENELAEAAMQEPKSIAEIIEEDGRFNTFADALDAAGMAEIFAAEGEITLFAPTDEAFDALPKGAVDFWFAEPEGALKDLILYHAVDGVLTAEEIAGLSALHTKLGEDIAVFVGEAGVILLNGHAEIIIVGIEASNGVIHVIDAVLLTDAGLG